MPVLSKSLILYRMVAGNNRPVASMAECLLSSLKSPQREKLESANTGIIFCDIVTEGV